MFDNQPATHLCRWNFPWSHSKSQPTSTVGSLFKIQLIHTFETQNFLLCPWFNKSLGQNYFKFLDLNQRHVEETPLTNHQPFGGIPSYGLVCIAINFANKIQVSLLFNGIESQGIFDIWSSHNFSSTSKGTKITSKAWRTRRLQKLGFGWLRVLIVDI